MTPASGLELLWMTESDLEVDRRRGKLVGVGWGDRVCRIFGELFACKQKATACAQGSHTWALHLGCMELQ